MDYIKLSRKITEWEWYSDINVCRLFIHLLLCANWKTGRFQGVEIPRGAMATSYNSLADQTGLSVMQVRTAIKKLKLTGEITVNQHPKYSIITVNNYNLYQGDNKVNNIDATQEQQACNTGLTTIEERKKERKEEDINSFSNEKPSILPPSEEQVFATIRELFNSVCGSYPRLVKMSEKRKKAIRARLRTGYTVEDFKLLFEKAEASDFLKGKNNRDWSASFDWLICDSNMAKVLEGKYDRREGKKYDTGGETTAGETGYVKRLVEQGFGEEFEGF